MENRMDRIDQPFENNQSLPENDLPPSPTLLQKQPTTLSEQQLLKRILRLTLLLGIMISISLVFGGVILYDSLLAPKEGLQLIAPGVKEWLLPLSFISYGVDFILNWKLQILRKQIPALRSGVDSTSSRQSAIMGLYFIVMGCLMLLMLWGSFSSDLAFPVILVAVLSFIFVDPYLSFRDKRKRRAAQRNKSEKNAKSIT